jgi:hypothetical protein
MPNKFHRQNLRMGSNPFGRKSNLAKIMEVFGPKKKDKKVKKTKTTKRMFANIGGSADEKRDIRKVEQMIGKTISSKREKGRMKANVGGKAKKKKKFPDMSGDGKVTMKDILMARGVIPKKKKTKKKVI